MATTTFTKRSKVKLVQGLIVRDPGAKGAANKDSDSVSTQRVLLKNTTPLMSADNHSQ